MSANTKVAATFHGVEFTHQPCCSSHGVDMDCATYRRTHFVEVGNCCAQWVAPEPTREQALRAHIADLLTDVDHFHTCADPSNCTCLLGRIRWAIAADELPTPDQTTAAIDTLARHIIGLRMWQDDFGAQAWQEIPEVAANDFEAITDRVKAIIADSDPSTTDYDDAYTHLRSRVDGAA